MGLKILTVLITLIIVVNIPNNAANENPPNANALKEIRLALFTMGDVYGSSLDVYLNIFNMHQSGSGIGYQWDVGNISYKILIKFIDDKGIFTGELNIRNYDLLMIPYMEAEYLILKHYKPTLYNWIWKKRFADFVKEGGGYIGYCASSLLVTKLSNKPNTLNEKMLNMMHIDITTVRSYVDAGLPFLIQLSGHPEDIGPSAYQWYTGWNASNPSDWLGGCCLDCIIDKNNPIFSDFYGVTRRIRWCGGPAYITSNSIDDNVKVLAYYPKQEISDNISTQIYAWKYVGRLIGLVRGFIRSAKTAESLSELIYFTPFQAVDWKKTDKIIETHLANKPFMTMEIYPNNNQGRIILCGGHPEDTVWWDGHIDELNDTKKNCLYDALNRWFCITPFNQTIEDEDTYNWWMVRRQTAWVSKTPDKDLPPIYGPSQVSDISPYIQESPIEIIGNVEIINGNMNLDLYYRFSDDNDTWTNWIFYNTDNNIFDNDWSWIFFAPYGPGYYQFYSIRRIQTEHEWIYETPPPGPDAICYIR
jgi:hypothetical protein